MVTSAFWSNLNPLDASLSSHCGAYDPSWAILLASMRWTSCSLYLFMGHWTMLIETLRLNSRPMETDLKRSHNTGYGQSSVFFASDTTYYRLHWVCRLMGGMAAFELSWPLLLPLLLALVASPPPPPPPSLIERLVSSWMLTLPATCPAASNPKAPMHIPLFLLPVSFFMRQLGSSSSKLMASVPWSFVLSRRGASS